MVQVLLRKRNTSVVCYYRLPLSDLRLVSLVKARNFVLEREINGSTLGMTYASQNDRNQKNRPKHSARTFLALFHLVRPINQLRCCVTLGLLCCLS